VKNKKIVFTTISTEGKKIGYQEYEVAKRKNVEGDFYPSDGDGFYLVKPNIVKSRTGYILQKYDNNLQEQWTQEVMPDAGGQFKYLSVEDILVSNNRLVIAQNTGISVAKYRLNILGYDAKNGSKVFDYETYDGEATPVLNTMHFEDNGDILVSGTYENNDYINDVNFDGVFISNSPPRARSNCSPRYPTRKKSSRCSKKRPEATPSAAKPNSSWKTWCTKAAPTT
jgi:hypothetical protein